MIWLQYAYMHDGKCRHGGNRFQGMSLNLALCYFFLTKTKVMLKV